MNTEQESFILKKHKEKFPIGSEVIYLGFKWIVTKNEDRESGFEESYDIPRLILETPTQKREIYPEAFCLVRPFIPA